MTLKTQVDIGVLNFLGHLTQSFMNGC